MLRRQPTFTVVAVLTLAIGFGPPIAIFALANWMVLRPVPGIPDSGSVSYYMHGTPSEHGLTVATAWLMEQHPTENAKLKSMVFRNRGPITLALTAGPVEFFVVEHLERPTPD